MPGEFIDASAPTAPAAAAPTGQFIDAPAPAENPFVAAGKSTLSGVGKALDAQRWAAAKVLTGEDDPDKQRTAERKAVGTEGIYQGMGQIPVVGHFLQGASDVVQDTVLDPLTAETMGAGPALKALGVAGKVAPAALKAMDATPYGRKLYDFLHWGGAVAREQGPETVQLARGTANYASSTGALVQKRLVAQFEKATKGLTDADKVEVGQALNGEKPAALAPNLKKAYDSLRDLTEQDYKIRREATQTVKFREITRDLNVTPEDKSKLAKAFNDGVPPSDPALAKTYQLIADIVDKEAPHRADYMPFAHKYAAPKSADNPERVVNPGKHSDPHNIPRQQTPLTSAKQFDEGFASMTKNAGRQAQTKIIHEHMDNLIDDPNVSKLFEHVLRATGTERDDGKIIWDHWKKLVGYPRAAVVSMTPRHAINILDLAANTVPPEKFPGFMKDTIALAGKLVMARGNPEEYARLTKEGRELGALSGEFTERKAFFQDFPKWLPGVGGKKIPVLAPWTSLMNSITWSVDEAAKQNYAKIIVDTGEAKGLKAGGLASSRLVDYEHTSPLVEALRYVAPFGTFRGSIPGQVLGGIARNPARAALYNRATQGLMYGSKPEQGQPGLELNNPTADVGRAFNYGAEPGSRVVNSGAGQYARATLGDPPKAALNAAQDLFSPGDSKPAPPISDPDAFLHRSVPYPSHWASYGQPWLPRYGKDGKLDLGFLADSALAGIPQARTILQSMGIGRFEWKGLASEAVRQTLGVTQK
jgi:hypothetical protein